MLFVLSFLIIHLVITNASHCAYYPNCSEIEQNRQNILCKCVPTKFNLRTLTIVVLHLNQETDRIIRYDLNVMPYLDMIFSLTGKYSCEGEICT